MTRTTRRSCGRGSRDALALPVRACPTMQVFPFSVHLDFEFFIELGFQSIVGSMSSLDEGKQMRGWVLPALKKR